MRYRVNRRPTSQRPLSKRWRMINRARSRTRARGEHAFRVVKQLRGFAKVRYRGLAKNLARADHVCARQSLPGPSTTAPGRDQVPTVRKLMVASSLCGDHRCRNHHSSFVPGPDCYNCFSQSLPNTDLCRPSLVAYGWIPKLLDH